MTFILHTDFFTEVVKGNVAGHSIIVQAGRNNAIPNANFELISMLSGGINFPAAPSTVRIAAGGNVNDDADGSGAREITIEGISDDLVSVTESIPTNGISASISTTTSFWRIRLAFASKGGTYSGSNEGDITIENTAGTLDYDLIPAGDGQTFSSAFPVPSDKDVFLVGSTINVSSQMPADIRLLLRPKFTTVSTPVSPIRSLGYFPGILDTLTVPFRNPIPVVPTSDIWFEAMGSTGTADVSIFTSYLLVDNS